MQKTAEVTPATLRTTVEIVLRNLYGDGGIRSAIRGTREGALWATWSVACVAEPPGVEVRLDRMNDWVPVPGNRLTTATARFVIPCDAIKPEAGWATIVGVIQPRYLAALEELRQLQPAACEGG